MKKKPIIAIVMAFIPGLGHAYLGKFSKMWGYAGTFFISLLLWAILYPEISYNSDAHIALLFVAFMIWLINMIDLVVTLILRADRNYYAGEGYNNLEGSPYDLRYAHLAFLSPHERYRRNKMLLLSIFPGIGHMYMGLIQRGISILLSFVGVFIAVVFLDSLVASHRLLLFLLLLPVVHIYSMFDALKQFDASHRGVPVEDKMIFSDWEYRMQEGHKSRLLALFLSIFPGVGHLYLGMQRRGLQLMGGFLMMIYIMDNMRISLFIFLLPVYWFFAFFDTLRLSNQPMQLDGMDKPLLSRVTPYHKWIGGFLLLLGLYYLLERVTSVFLISYFPQWVLMYEKIKYMLPTVLVSFALILLGIRLMFGNKAASRDRYGHMDE